jgi:predicted Na+-dependent transporter
LSIVSSLTARAWLDTVKAVVWSFLGLRARSDFDRDARQLKPLQVIAVGLLGVFVFVGALAALVHWIVPA